MVVCCDEVSTVLSDSGQGVYFFKQKTAYDLRISDWSSDVCSSDLALTNRCFPPLGNRTLKTFILIASPCDRDAQARSGKRCPICARSLPTGSQCSSWRQRCHLPKGRVPRHVRLSPLCRRHHRGQIRRRQ